MRTFWSCHLIMNRNTTMVVGTFVICQLFRWGGTSPPFLKWTPYTNTNISSCYHPYFQQMLNMSPANIPTSTVVERVLLQTRHCHHPTVWLFPLSSVTGSARWLPWLRWRFWHWWSIWWLRDRCQTGTTWPSSWCWRSHHSTIYSSFRWS